MSLSLHLKKVGGRRLAKLLRSAAHLCAARYWQVRFWFNWRVGYFRGAPGPRSTVSWTVWIDGHGHGVESLESVCAGLRARIPMAELGVILDRGVSVSGVGLRATSVIAALKVSCSDYVSFVQAGDRFNISKLRQLAEAMTAMPLAIITNAVIRAQRLAAPAFACQARFDKTLLNAARMVPGLVLFRTADLATWLSCNNSYIAVSDITVNRLSELDCDSVTFIDEILIDRVTWPQRAARLAFDCSSARPDEGVRELTVSILIPTRDQLHLLQSCIASIEATVSQVKYELIIIDNGSEQSETIDYLKTLTLRGAIVLEAPGDFNFSALINRGAGLATGEFLLLLNNDIECQQSGWLDALVNVAANARTGCVGPLLLYSDGRVQNAGLVVGIRDQAGAPVRGWRVADYLKTYPWPYSREVAAVTGACLLVRARLFREVGGFNEEFARAYNDVDFCMKLGKAGYTNIFVANVQLLHHESRTRGFELTAHEDAHFKSEAKLLNDLWHTDTMRDPYYSKLLSKIDEAAAIGI